MAGAQCEPIRISKDEILIAQLPALYFEVNVAGF
jgi:hypothetical protein